MITCLLSKATWIKWLQRLLKVSHSRINVSIWWISFRLNQMKKKQSEFFRFGWITNAIRFVFSNEVKSKRLKNIINIIKHFCPNINVSFYCNLFTFDSKRNANMQLRWELRGKKALKPTNRGMKKKEKLESDLDSILVSIHRRPSTQSCAHSEKIKQERKKATNPCSTTIAERRKTNIQIRNIQLCLSVCLSMCLRVLFMWMDQVFWRCDAEKGAQKKARVKSNRVNCMHKVPFIAYLVI